MHDKQECVDSEAVSLEDILAYATGDESNPARAHVEHCSACKSRAMEYMAIDRSLQRQLARVDCPESMMLGELTLGLLDPGDALVLRSHLTWCTHCSQEMDQLRDALRGDPVEEFAPGPHWVQRIIARLLPPIPQSTPLAYGIRGSAGTTAKTYEAGSLTISLSCVSEVQGRTRSWTLLGLVTSTDAEFSFSGAQVKLRSEDQVLAQETLDEWGNFMLSGLQRGVYTLEMEVADRVLVLESVEVGRGD